MTWLRWRAWHDQAYHAAPAGASEDPIVGSRKGINFLPQNPTLGGVAAPKLRPPEQHRRLSAVSSPFRRT
jgi:hypothetical protein